MPRALPVGPLVNYGYEGEVLHLVEIEPVRGLAVGATLSLKARSDWLVCREICIPEGVDLILTDYKLPEFDGIELVRRLRESAGKAA